MEKTVAGRIYELTLWVNPDEKESDIESMVNTVQERITQAEGSMLNSGKFSPRRLEYPIRHAVSGHFGLLRFSGGNVTLENLHQSLRHEPRVLRYCITRVSPKENAVSDPSVRASKRHPRFDETAKPLAKTPAPQEKKIIMEELNEKLEQILGDDISSGDNTSL